MMENVGNWYRCKSGGIVYNQCVTLLKRGDFGLIFSLLSWCGAVRKKKYLSCKPLMLRRSRSCCIHSMILRLVLWLISCYHIHVTRQRYHG